MYVSGYTSGERGKIQSISRDATTQQLPPRIEGNTIIGHICNTTEPLTIMSPRGLSLPWVPNPSKNTNIIRCVT